MSPSTIKPFWALVFILAIILPALVLSFLSFRALEREEAYMEKQVEKSYLSEVRLQVSEIKTRLALLQEELAEKIPLASAEEVDGALKNWAGTDALIDVPFYISADKEILYPKITEDLSEAEISFLNWNREFVKDKVAIPVYQNIALYYQEVVLSESEKLENQQRVTLTSSDETRRDTEDVTDPVVHQEANVPTRADTDQGPIDNSEEFLNKQKTLGTTVLKDELSKDQEAEAPAPVKEKKVISPENRDKNDKHFEYSAETESIPALESEERENAALDELAEEIGSVDESDLDVSKSLLNEEQSIVTKNDLKTEEAKQYRPPSQSLDIEQEIQAEQSRSIWQDVLSEAPVSKKREEQKAIEQFEKYEEVRNLVYDQAAEEGQQRLQRNVAPLKGGERLVTNTPESIFIAEPLNFTEIISKGDEGIIPRFIEEQLKLLYWKKDSAGNITGCMLNNNSLVNYITESIKDPLDENRLMTILNDTGHPLLQPAEIAKIDWRVPFLSREISEILPRWEVAVYLTNPAAITQEANSITFIMAAMIVLLVASILLGGAFFLRTFYSEMDLAAKKTTFVANVSHELKTPLTSIRMFAEMLKEKRQKNPEKQERYLSLMVSETERLSRLVNNVLDFSKMSQGKRKYHLEQVNLTSFCEDILNRQRLRLETAGFKILFLAPEKPIICEIDAEALSQCLINLISNSEKYSTDQKEIQIKLHQTGNHHAIDILDRGIGIPKAQAKRIFKAFYRVDDSLTTKISGSGLGLSISEKIIRDMGGKLEYLPRKGGGSVFRISFPLK